MDLQLVFGIFFVLFLGWLFERLVVRSFLQHRKNLAFQRRIDELINWNDEQLRRLYEDFLVDKNDPQASSFEEFKQYHKTLSFQVQMTLGPDVDAPSAKEFAAAAMAHVLTNDIDDPDTKMEMVKAGIDQLDA